MSDENKLRVTIKKEGNHYQLMGHPGDDKVEMRLDDRVLGRSWTEWSEKMLECDPNFLENNLSEADQLVLGRSLFDKIRELLVKSDPSRGEEKPVDIWLDCTDQEIIRLPWLVMARDGLFLHNLGWSVSYTTGRRVTPYLELPEDLRVLAAMPQPTSVAETEAQSHLEELENKLHDPYSASSKACSLRAVHTWYEFGDVLQEWKPHFLYYYGYGIASNANGNQEEAKLLWATGQDRKPFYRSAADLRKLLDTMGMDKPRLAYFNGFLGDGDKMLRFGLDLSGSLEAVVVNRGKIPEKIARKQAMDFWHKLLMGANTSPHMVIATLAQEQLIFQTAWNNDRWAVPVLFRHYDEWKNASLNLREKIDDPYWYLKVDRREQWNLMAEDCRQMLKHKRVRSLVYLWYGEKGQGIDHFHRRIYEQFKLELERVTLLQIRARWPETLAFNNQAEAFKIAEAMILEAFETDVMEWIPGIIRKRSLGTSDQRILVYIRHEPLPSDASDWLRFIADFYLRWWDTEFNPILEAANAHGLLGVSAITTKPSDFPKEFENIPNQSLTLNATIYHPLNELVSVSINDLIRFIYANDINIPSDKQKVILGNILKKTGGDYDKTVAELKILVERVWIERSKDKPSVSSQKITKEPHVNINYEYDVFLSHSSLDKLEVRKLANKLKTDGLRVWFDEWTILPGDSIPQAIGNGLEKSRVLVLVMSEHAFGADWVTLERHTSLFRDPMNRERRFIPLLLSDCSIPEMLGQFKYIDYRNKDEEFYKQLLTSLKK